MAESNSEVCVWVFQMGCLGLFGLRLSKDWKHFLLFVCWVCVWSGWWGLLALSWSAAGLRWVFTFCPAGFTVSPYMIFGTDTAHSIFVFQPFLQWRCRFSLWCVVFVLASFSQALLGVRGRHIVAVAHRMDKMFTTLWSWRNNLPYFFLFHIYTKIEQVLIIIVFLCGSVVEHCVSSAKGCGFDSQGTHILIKNV